MERLPLTTAQKTLDGVNVGFIVANAVLYFAGGHKWYSLATAGCGAVLLVVTVHLQLSTQRIRWRTQQMVDARLARYGR